MLNTNVELTKIKILIEICKFDYLKNNYNIIHFN